MENSKNKALSKLSKYLILFMTTMLIEGTYRISVINNHFSDFDYIHIVKLSSNINMIISALFFVFVLIIILIICFITNEVFNLKLSKNSIINGFILVVAVFIIFQILKLTIHITFLQVPDCDLTTKDSLTNSLKKTEWFKYITIANILMILIGTIAFSIGMYKKENIFNTFMITSIFLICYLIVLF